MGDAWRAECWQLQQARLDANVRKFFRALGPATVGSAGVQLAMFADTIIASFLAAGAISALYYADRINQLPIGVIGIAVGTVLLPEMSRRLAAGDEPRRAQRAKPRDRIDAVADHSLSGRLSVIPDLIMRALFLRGKFTSTMRWPPAPDACGLCDRSHSLCADPRHDRSVFCARRYRDPGQGVADRSRNQYPDSRSP